MVAIKDYIHKFKIGQQEIHLKINFNEYWECEIIKGETGMGNSTGGVYKSLEEYIANKEMSHRYTYNFFKHGYKYAKENL